MLGLLDSYSYNLRIAQVFGVNSAVFISCINEEYRYVERSSKTGEVENHVSLSRAEIYGRTAIDDEKQREVELALQSCGVLTVKPLQNIPGKNYYVLNREVLEKIIKSEDPVKVLEDSNMTQFIRRTRVEPRSKRQIGIEKLKKCIDLEDPVMQQYFIDWVDGVYAKQRGFLSPGAIKIAIEELYQYAKDDEQKRISVIRIAIKNGMRDMTWAIREYEKENPPTEGSRNFGEYSDMKSEEPALSDYEAF